jgi:hypothetical protein
MSRPWSANPTNLPPSHDLDKETLHEGLKGLHRCAEEFKHVRLPQQKLFTLFSLGFQYLVYMAQNHPGAYILRVEDARLAEKLSKKAKDAHTRKLMSALIFPRKLKVGPSMIFLDYFHMSSWNLTRDIPPKKMRSSLVVKNTTTNPFQELPDQEPSEEQKGLYYDVLRNLGHKTILIAHDIAPEGVMDHEFPFIKKEQERVPGVILNGDFDSES